MQCKENMMKEYVNGLKPFDKKLILPVKLIFDSIQTQN